LIRGTSAWRDVISNSKQLPRKRKSTLPHEGGGVPWTSRKGGKGRARKKKVKWGVGGNAMSTRREGP